MVHQLSHCCNAAWQRSQACDFRKYRRDVLTVGGLRGTRKEFSVRAVALCNIVAGEIGGFCTT